MRFCQFYLRLPFGIGHSSMQCSRCSHRSSWLFSRKVCESCNFLKHVRYFSSFCRFGMKVRKKKNGTLDFILRNLTVSRPACDAGARKKEYKCRSTEATYEWALLCSYSSSTALCFSLALLVLLLCCCIAHGPTGSCGSHGTTAATL